MFSSYKKSLWSFGRSYVVRKENTRTKCLQFHRKLVALYLKMTECSFQEWGHSCSCGNQQTSAFQLMACWYNCSVREGSLLYLDPVKQCYWQALPEFHFHQGCLNVFVSHLSFCDRMPERRHRFKTIAKGLLTIFLLITHIKTRLRK